MDIPLINNRPFVYVAGFGKFLNIPYETKREEKKKLGYFAYIFNGIKDFFKDTKMYNITIEHDGKKESYSTSLMMICSATRVAGFESFFNDVKLDDDLFEVYIITASKRLDILGALGLSVVGDVTAIDNVVAFRTSSLKIVFDKYPKKAWCVDGEKLELRKKTFNISNLKDFKMLVPKKNLNKLLTKNYKD